MARLVIPHPEKGPQKTYLTAEVAAAATSSTVENNDGFATNDLVLFGDYGQEKSEIVTLTSTTGTTTIGHTSGPSFAHGARTPVYQLPFNQVEISSATAEGGTYSVVATVTIDADETYTIYNHTTGGSSTWYKIRYKNSVTTTYSDYSDEIQATGFTTNSLGSMTDEILESFGDPDSKEVSRDHVRDILNAHQRSLVIKIIKSYPDYFGAYATQALTTTNSYSYPTRFLAFKRVDIGNSTTDNYNAEFRKIGDIDPTLSYLESDPKIELRDSTWKTYPDCAGKTAYLHYWQYPADMDNDNDEHGLPYGGRDVLVAFATYRLWLNKDPERATIVKRLYNELLEEYMEFVGQRRQAQNNMFQTLSFGEDDYSWTRY